MIEWIGLAAVVVALTAVLGIRAPDVGGRAAAKVACMIERAGGGHGTCNGPSTGAGAQPVPAGQPARPSHPAQRPTSSSAGADGEEVVAASLRQTGAHATAAPLSWPTRPYDAARDQHGSCTVTTSTEQSAIRRYFWGWSTNEAVFTGICTGDDGAQFACTRSYTQRLGTFIFNSGWHGKPNHDDGWICGNRPVTTGRDGKPITVGPANVSVSTCHARVGVLQPCVAADSQLVYTCVTAVPDAPPQCYPLDQSQKWLGDHGYMACQPPGVDAGDPSVRCIVGVEGDTVTVNCEVEDDGSVADCEQAAAPPSADVQCPAGPPSPATSAVTVSVTNVDTGRCVTVGPGHADAADATDLDRDAIRFVRLAVARWASAWGLNAASIPPIDIVIDRNAFVGSQLDYRPGDQRVKIVIMPELLKSPATIEHELGHLWPRLASGIAPKRNRSWQATLVDETLADQAVFDHGWPNTTLPVDYQVLGVLKPKLVTRDVRGPAEGDGMTTAAQAAQYASRHRGGMGDYNVYVGPLNLAYRRVVEAIAAHIAGGPSSGPPPALSTQPPTVVAQAIEQAGELRAGAVAAGLFAAHDSAPTIEDLIQFTEAAAQEVGLPDGTVTNAFASVGFTAEFLAGLPEQDEPEPQLDVPICMGSGFSSDEDDGGGGGGGLGGGGGSDMSSMLAALCGSLKGPGSP